jgi:hypothetical protein
MKQRKFLATIRIVYMGLGAGGMFITSEVT